MTARAVLGALLAAGLCGCAAAGGPRAQTMLRLEPALPPAAQATPASATPPLVLAPVAGQGASAGRRYVYVRADAPREVRQAATLFWEEPPPTLVERALLRGLTARLGAPVLPAALAAGGDTRLLRVTLQRFEEVDGPGRQARVALDAMALGTVKLGAVDSHARAPLLVGRFCGAAAIEGEAASARALAFETALNQAMDSLASALGHPYAAPQAAC